jgi:uncharacterized protein (DUF2147 family)
MNKKNLIMAGVLVALIAVAYLYKGPVAERQAQKDKPDNFLSSLDISAIDRIETEGKGSKKVFVKNGETWKEEGAKHELLDSVAIANALDTLKKAKEADMALVSQVKDKQAEFETSGDKGLRLILKQGDQVLRDFVVGKNSGDFQGAYVTEWDSDKTYEARANLVASFAVDNWYNKTIFAVGDKEISKIRFQFPSREFTLEKKEGKWSGTLPYKFEVNEEKMSRIVEIMSNLTATKIPKQEFKGSGLEKNQMIIQATGDGIDQVLMVGDKDAEGFYYAKRGDSDNLYLITEEEREALDKRISDFN